MYTEKRDAVCGEPNDILNCSHFTWTMHVNRKIAAVFSSEDYTHQSDELTVRSKVDMLLDSFAI